MRTRIHKLTLVAVAVIGASAMLTTPASALNSYTSLCPTLQTTLCEGEGAPKAAGLAVDNSTGAAVGDVWVDQGSASVEQKLLEYNASGEPLREVNRENLPSDAYPIFGPESHGQLKGVAVDPSDGDVYVATALEEGEGLVTKFDPLGNFQWQISESEIPQEPSEDPIALAVDPTDGDFYMSEGEVYKDRVNHVIDKFTSSGKYVDQLAIGKGLVAGTGAIAVDKKGELYAATGAGLQEYSSTGAPIDCPNGSNIVLDVSAQSVAIDSTDDHIFTIQASAGGNYFVAEYAAPCVTTPIATFGEGEISTTTYAAHKDIAVNEATHDVYVSHGGATASNVVIFGQVTVPDVVTAVSASSVTRTSAVLSGSVDPDGTSVTGCEFEYGSTPSYGLSVPCEQALPLEGNAPVTVSAEIKGVQEPPGSRVYYRLKASNAAGHNAGDGQAFYLESYPSPVVGGLPATRVSQFAATLNGTLRASEALVNYHFEYGTSTAYGQVQPLPDDYAPVSAETVPIAQSVNSLQAGTTYHYRLVASSPGGTQVTGPDETFTTLPVPAPAVQTGAASGVGVGAATLSGAIDPYGWDTTYLFQYGTSTAYGSSWPTVQVDMGALEGPQPVLVNVPNLLLSTTYHYRLVATNGGGTTYGPDMTFTTGEYPAQIIQEPVSLHTLLVPSGKTTKPVGKKTTKKHKKSNKRKKGKTHHHAKHTKPKTKK